MSDGANVYRSETWDCQLHTFFPSVYCETRNRAPSTSLSLQRHSIATCDASGGQLAAAAYPASVITLVLSDVVGDPLDVIASVC